MVAALVIGQLSQTEEGRAGLLRCGPEVILDYFPQITRDVSELVNRSVQRMRGYGYDYGYN